MFRTATDESHWTPLPRLLRYAWPYRTRIGIHLLLSILIALLELLQPWPVKIVIDSILGNHPLPLGLLPPPYLSDKVWLLIAVVAAGLGLKFIITGLTVLESYVNIDMRQRILLALKGELFQHLQRQSFAFHERRRLGDSIYRVSNDAYCAEDIVASTLNLLISAVTLIGMFSIAFTIDWQLALLSAAVIPLLYASFGFYSRQITPKVQRVQEMEAESMSIVQEILCNLRVVKAFTREDDELQRFTRQGHHTMRERVGLTVQQSLFAATVGVLTAAGTALVLGVGAFHVLRGSLTLGELIVVLSYLASVFGPLESLSGTLISIQADLAKAKRVFEILDAEPDVKDLPGAVILKRPAGRVTFDRVSFGYREGVTVLRDIDLDVRPGQAIGIVGPTGAGKTTLVSLIPRFYDVIAGRLVIDGVDARGIQLKSLRQQISLVPQEPILFSGTIMENIRYGNPGATFDQIISAAKAANAHEFITRLPLSYEAHSGERGVQLSQGERQRISIARAFLKNAPILILDEPTSSVDSETEALILEALERLTVGRTTFMIAHRLSTLRLADQIIVLQEGRIAEQGNHRDLVQNGKLYASLYHFQAQGSL